MPYPSENIYPSENVYPGGLSSMPTTCFSVVRGKKVRVTEVDACGVPVYETGSYVVSDGFIQVAITTELETGDEFVEKNADGKLCINERAPDEFKRLNVTVDWCRVDPDIIELITGYPVELNDTEDAVGFRIREGVADRRWALEVWTGLAGSQCASGGLEYGYILIPTITGSTLGDITIANAATTFQTTGYSEGPGGWGVGPWEVIGSADTPTVLADPFVAGEHALLRVTPVAPPAATCGSADMPSAPTSP